MPKCFQSVKNKLSLLAPLHAHGAKFPWWVLAEYQHPAYSPLENDSVQGIATGELLQLMIDVLQRGDATNREQSKEFWQSSCMRFCVGFHKPEYNVSRIFVQKRSDYLTCLELYVDGELAVSFREPVWPHLHQHAATQIGVVKVLSGSVDAMRAALELMKISPEINALVPEYGAAVSNPEVASRFVA